MNSTDWRMRNDTITGAFIQKFNEWLDDKGQADVLDYLTKYFGKQVETLQLNPHEPILLYDTFASGRTMLIKQLHLSKRKSKRFRFISSLEGSKPVSSPDRIFLERINMERKQFEGDRIERRENRRIGNAGCQ